MVLVDVVDHRDSGIVQKESHQHDDAELEEIVEQRKALSEERQFLGVLTITDGFLLNVPHAARAGFVLVRNVLAGADCLSVLLRKGPVSGYMIGDIAPNGMRLFLGNEAFRGLGNFHQNASYTIEGVGIVFIRYVNINCC